MAITLRGTASNPADNSTLYDSVERSITPVAGMVAGDLCILVVHRRALTSIAISNTGGQSWNTPTQRQTGSSTAVVFWCRFNGTWSANPSITSITTANLDITLYMEAWIPTTGSNTWAVDVAESYHTFAAPVTPFDVTATGRTTVAANTVTTAYFLSLSGNIWAVQTGGWANAGSAQYRNPDVNTSKPISLSGVYKIQTAAGATGNVTNRETSHGGSGSDAGMWIVNSFKEQSSGVTIGSISTGATAILNGQTSITLTGTSFGAAHTGSADIIVSPTNNIADGAAVVQTQTAWADTSVTFTAVLSAFAYFTNLFVFVKNSSGSSNSSGFVIQRGSVASFALQLKNINGSANEANLTGLKYAVYPTSDVLGTALSSGSAATTDASGNLGAVSSYTLVSGGPLAINDDAVIVVWKSGASAALTLGTIYQLPPTYS